MINCDKGHYKKLFIYQLVYYTYSKHDIENGL